MLTLLVLVTHSRVGLERRVANLLRTLPPRDLVLLLAGSRFQRTRLQSIQKRGTLPPQARLLLQGFRLEATPPNQFLLVLRDGEQILTGALKRLRRFLGQQVTPPPAVRFLPVAPGMASGQPIHLARRRLFGVPMSLHLGPPLLLNRTWLASLPGRIMTRFLAGNQADLLMALELAGGGTWYPASLTSPQPRSPFAFNSKDTVSWYRRYIHKRELPVSVRRRRGSLQVLASPGLGIDIELTSHCNSECIFCPRRHTRHFGHMSDDTFNKLLEQIRNEPIGTIYFIGRGEPLLHPRFLEYIQRIRELSGIHFEVFTNGLALTPRLVDRLAELNDPILDITINVSLHTLDVATHRRLTGTNLEIVSDNLRHLQRRADRLKVSYAFVTNKINEREMARLRRYLDRTGNRRWDISLVYNKGGMIPPGELFDDEFYRRQLQGHLTGVDPYGPCWYSYCGLYYFVNFRGEFTLCHDDFLEETILGTVGSESLEDIRQRVENLARRGGAERCRRCNKRQREQHHGENVEPEAQVMNHFDVAL